MSPSASASWTTDNGTFYGQDYSIDHTANDHQTSSTSTSATFSATKSDDGTTTYGGTGKAIVSQGDHYVNSESGSFNYNSDDDLDYTGYGSHSLSISHSKSEARDVSSTVFTGYSLDTDGSWITGDTDTSVTGFGHATYTDSSFYYDQDGGDSNGNSTGHILRTESVGYSYTQHPHNAISSDDEDGGPAISGNGSFSITGTGTYTSVGTVNSVMDYDTLSHVTSDVTDTYSDGGHWSEDYTNSGLHRSDPTNDSPDGTHSYSYHADTTTVAGADSSSDDSTSYPLTPNLLEGSPWSDDGGWDVGGVAPQPSAITPGTDAVGTMPNLTDPNSVVGQVQSQLAGAPMSGTAAQSAASAPATATPPPAPPAPVQAPPPAPAPAPVAPPAPPPAAPEHWWQKVGNVIRASVEADANRAAAVVQFAGSAVGINEEKVAEAAAFAKGFVEGADQGIANVVNGTQDAIVGLVNLSTKISPIGAGLSALGVNTQIPMSNWSNGLIYQEGSTEHAVSKFLGGQAVITLATLGIGPAAEAAEAADAAETTGTLQNSGVWKWVFGGTQAQRLTALQYGVKLLEEFEADGGTFVKEFSNEWWAEYRPFANGAAPEIALNPLGTSEGTLLEELIHHMQVSDLTVEELQEIFANKVLVQAVESQAHEILRALGYARVFFPF